MSEPLRGYLRRHGTGEAILPAIRRFVREHGVPGPSGVREPSPRLGLPEAAIRAAVTYYADLHEDAAAVRVCRGTSCATRCVIAPNPCGDFPGVRPRWKRGVSKAASAGAARMLLRREVMRGAT